MHGQPDRKRRRRLLLAALLAVAIGVLAFLLVPKPWPEISRSEFLVEVRSGHLQEIEIEDGETILEVSATRGRFRAAIKPSETQPLAELRARGIRIRYSSSLRLRDRLPRGRGFTLELN